jgi:O-antigen/teichoic acid export membrane protein
MGIIARQSFKSGIATYIGVVMGMVNTIILYPYFLDIEEIGIISFISTTAALFTPFILLGFGNVVLRYYSYYQGSTSDKNYFFSFVSSVVAISSLIFFLVFLLFNHQIQSHFSDNTSISGMVILILFAIATVLPFSQIIQLYCGSLGRTAVPSMLSQLYKFAIPIFACGYYFDWYSFNSVLVGMLLFQICLLIVLLIYFKTLDNVHYKIPKIAEIKTDENIKPILKFAFFSIVGGIGYSFSNQIDMVMIADMSSTYNLGLYSWAFNVANAISTPAALIIGIASPIIAGHLKNENISEIGKIYKQSVSTLLTVCLGIFLLLCLTIDDLFGLMSKGQEFALAKNTLVMLGVAKLVEVTISLNNHIISLSKFYLYNVGFLIVSSIVNVFLNFILIPIYGIEGCAVATIVSVLLFSTLKIVFLKLRFNLQPFSINLLYILLIAVALFSILHNFLPSTSNHIVDILLVSSIFSSLYALIIYRYSLVPEINEFVNKQLIRMGIKPFDR